MEAESSSLLNTVIHLVDDNIFHFEEDDSEHGQRLYSGLRALRDGLLRVADFSDTVRKEAVKYNFSEETPGNGFLSFCNITDQALVCVLDLSKKISSGRHSLLFRKVHYVKEIEAWGQTLASLTTLLDYLISTLLPMCQDENLMPDVDITPSELLSVLNTISQYSFYGRCLGFHYYESLQKTLKYLNIGMCAFSEIYYSNGGFMKRTRQSFFTSGKYVMNPEHRARRIVDVVQYSSVDFIKSFWSLADTELLTQLPGIVGHGLAVNQPILVPCTDTNVLSTEGRRIVVPAPSSHLPAKPIPCVLLSSQMREGMPGKNQFKGCVFPSSDKLIYHCHGGGFVTQSTKAQEVFLRDWALHLGVPIFSIDYSLAPEAKYPRPLEEVFTAYAWMLSHLEMLGTTGTKIILTGDSAGGNLMTALTIKCIEKKIRVPDGLFLVYTPFSVRMKPTPSRLLAICDPLLPLGFALRCLKAYAGDSSSSSEESSPTGTFQSFPASPLSEGMVRDISNGSVDSVDSADPGEVFPNLLQLKFDHSSENSTENGEIPCKPDNEKHNTQGVIKENGQIPGNHSDKKDTELHGDSSHRNDQNEMMKSRSLSDPEMDTMTTVSLTSERSGSSKPCTDETRKAEEEAREAKSKMYVSEFLQKYATGTNGEKKKDLNITLNSDDSEENDEVEDNLASERKMSGKLSSKIGMAKEAVWDGITAGAGWLSFKQRKKSDSSPTLQSPPSQKPTNSATTKVKRVPSLGRITLGLEKLRRDSSASLLEQFVNIKLSDDHYINPITAPHEVLSQFPPTSIMTVEYDFCLDDGVTMARLLRKLGVPVTLDILQKLPHGFLNLNLNSKEAHEGCKLSVTRLRKLFEGLQETREKS